MPPNPKEVCDSEDEHELLSPPRPAGDHRVASLTSLSRGEVAPAVRVMVESQDQEHNQHQASTLPQGNLRTPGGREVVQGSTVTIGDFASASAQDSTDSTGELLRQAHLDLMAPTQNCIDVTDPPASPNMTRTKRRLTGGEEVPPRASAGKLKRIKTTPATMSQSPSEGTVPGATIPGQYFADTEGFTVHAGHDEDRAIQVMLATSETIPGETMPGAEEISLPAQHQQTPAHQTRRKSLSKVTSPEEQSSNLTPWSASVIGNSSALTNNKPSHHSSDRLAHDSSDAPQSDDYLIGLPRENYKPRPSRSRSERVVLEEPTDYSVRPEKAAAKPKRAKTISHSPVKSGTPVADGPNIFPDNPILQAPDFEALSPPLPSTVVSDRLPPVPEVPYLDMELPTTIPDTAAAVSVATPAKRGPKPKKDAKPKKAPRKRGRPRKNPLPEPDPVVLDDDQTDELALPEADRKSSNNDVQVVIESGKGAPDVKSILDALNQKFPPAATTISPPPEETETSRAEEVHSGAGNEDVDDKENSLDVKSPSHKLTETKSTTSTPAKFRPPKITKPDVLPITTPTAEPDKAAAQPEEPKRSTPAPATKAGSNSSMMSWQARSVHRVGLSKTQRTQSLLKVVKGPRSS